MTSSESPFEKEFHAAVKALQTGEASISLEICKRLIQNSPNNEDVLHLTGLAYRACGQPHEGRINIEKAAALSPHNVAILNNLGLILMESGEVGRAIVILERAIDLQSSFPTTHANLGHAYLKSENKKNAERSYRTALRYNPVQVDALSNLVQILAAESRLDELNLDVNNPQLPNVPDVLKARGIVAMHEQKYEAAVECFETAILQSHASPALLNHLAIANSKLGHTEQSLNLLEQVIKDAPQFSESYTNAADILKYSDPEKAIPYCEAARRLDPENSHICDLLGFLHFLAGRNEEAIKFYDLALRYDPAFLRAVFHKAGASFLTGDFETAWQCYLRRYGPQHSEGSPFPDTLDCSLLEPSLGEQVAIWTDQGLGDEILQLGLVHDLFKAGQLHTLSTSARLVPLAERSFPGTRVLSHEQCKDLSDSEWSIDKQCPAIGLGLRYRRSWQDFPDRASYLLADPDRAMAVRQRYLGESGLRPLVGLSWRSANTLFGAEKSLDLAFLLSFFSDDNMTWVNLQYGDVTQEIQSVNTSIIHDPSIDPLQDMDAFAAQVAALDLVITTSNTTAHMAGALGKPTITLVPRRGPGWLWYWFDARSDSPWYPNMTLFRQDKDGNWASTLTAAAQAAREILK